MRTLLLFLFAGCIIGNASAQTAIDFESFSLPGNDTFYVNYSQPGQDVGFGAGSVHFQCVYDTAFGGSWTEGFSYSNMTDSVTSGWGNQYSAKPAKGYNNSSNYVVYWNGYTHKPKLVLPGDGEPPFVKRFTGFYITNSTYAYNSMRDGDFVARKFGDTTGTNSGLPQGDYPDWFKLTVYGYFQGQLKADSVSFYLADFRFPNSADDYIVKDWRWVDLSPLGNVDSLEFSLSSSDNDPQWGMNTPAYFCMDNLTALISTGVQHMPETFAAKVYPVPAKDVLYVEADRQTASTISIIDATGKTLISVAVTDAKTSLSVASLPAGMYFLQLSDGKQIARQRFIKQ